MGIGQRNSLSLLLLALTWPAVPAVPAATTAPTASSPTSTASGAYQVEIVIFRANSPPPGGEDLGASAEGRGFNRQLDSGVPPPTIYRTLEASQMQLGGVASRLRANGNWQVLAHAG